MNKNKIDILCEYLNKNGAKQYPISNKELSESTDYIKNGYLKMLAVILQQSGNVSNAQLEMFKRIIVGAETEKTAEDFLRMALDIEIEDYIKFSDECKDLKLKYRWVLDAIILTCVQERTAEQLKLIAQFCESYKVSKDELKYIAAMAKAIIGMQVSEYVTAYETKENSIPDTIFSDYMYLIANECICYNEHMTIFQASYKQKFSIQVLQKIQEVNTPCIKIIGASIDVANCNLKFSGKEKVILESCHFTGGDKEINFKNYNEVIIFEKCKEVIIRNCTFEHFQTRTINLNSIDSVLIDGCKFIDCEYYDSERIYFSSGTRIYEYSVIYVSNIFDRLNLINTSFTDCSGINDKYQGFSKNAFICNIDSFVDNCSFTNCWYRNSERDITEGVKMFTRKSSATNCKFENSSPFN